MGKGAINHLGMGFNEDVLSGDSAMRCKMSAGKSGLNLISAHSVGQESMIGSGAKAVADQTPDTLVVKNVAKSSAVRPSLYEKVPFWSEFLQRSLLIAP